MPCRPPVSVANRKYLPAPTASARVVRAGGVRIPPGNTDEVEMFPKRLPEIFCQVQPWIFSDVTVIALVHGAPIPFDDMSPFIEGVIAGFTGEAAKVRYNNLGPSIATGNRYIKCLTNPVVRVVQVRSAVATGGG